MASNNYRKPHGRLTDRGELTGPTILPWSRFLQTKKIRLFAALGHDTRNTAFRTKDVVDLLELVGTKPEANAFTPSKDHRSVSLQDVILELFPQGVVGVTAKRRNKLINDRLVELNRDTLSDRTIERALKVLGERIKS